MLSCHFAGCTIWSYVTLHRCPFPQVRVSIENHTELPQMLQMPLRGVAQVEHNAVLTRRNLTLWYVSKMGIVWYIHLFIFPRKHRNWQRTSSEGTNITGFARCRGYQVKLKVIVQSISLFGIITFQAWESLTCPVLYLAIKSTSARNNRRALVLSGAQKEEV